MDFSSECLEYHPGFLQKQMADRYLQQLWDELEWTQKKIVIFGRRRLQPRLIAWYGDASAKYGYSGLSLTPLSWHPGLLEIRRQVEEFTSAGFNSVLANAYRDGNDSVAAHRDRELKHLDNTIVAIVTLGAQRAFHVRPAGGGSSRDLAPASGDLIVMGGSCQSDWEHGVPKTKRPVGPRVSASWRWSLGGADPEDDGHLPDHTPT